MDTEHLRTFLEVARARHFGRAAESLHISQSAVSARIRMLETALGAELFQRKRNDIQLTGAGQRLLHHAETIVAAWARARQASGLDAAYQQVLVVGGMFDLWPVLLDDWLAALPETLPGVMLTAEAHTAQVLVRRLIDGLLDLAVLFEPPQTPELVAREVTRIELVLVAARAGLDAGQAMRDGYIWVDWGLSFEHMHARCFPEPAPPVLRCALGATALAFLERRGGAAYLPAAVLERQPGGTTLYRVADAPVFERSVYVLYRAGADNEALLKNAVQRLVDAVA